MSIRPTSSLFLRLGFIALMTPQIAFSTGEDPEFLDQEDKAQGRVTTPAPQFLSFDSLPPKAFPLILDQLSKKDLLNFRLVEKNLRHHIAPFIANIQSMGDFPKEEQIKNVFCQLIQFEYWKGKTPSEDFVKLFRRAPAKSLTLSYLTISPKSMEVISPMLPMNLERLFLANSDMGATAVLAMIPHLSEGLTTLHLGGNNLGTLGMQTLGPCLSKTLRDLFLGNTNMGDEGAQTLANHFPKNIENLCLSKNNIRVVGLQALGPCFSKSGLVSLDLSDNNMEGEGAQVLGPHLRATRLKKLSLSGNNLGDAGIQEIVINLPSSLIKLFLRDNNVGNVGAQALAFNPPKDLELLDMDDNNVGNVGAQALADSLLPSKNLKILRLNSSGIWNVIFKALLGATDTINLSNQNLEILGGRALAPHLRDGLTKIDLSNSNLGDAGIQEIAINLPSSLRKLFLKNNNISNAGLRILLPNLPAGLALLDLDGNEAGDSGTQTVAEHLPAGLKTLRLKITIGDGALSALLDAIQRTDLQHLHIFQPSHKSSLYKLRNRQNQPVRTHFFVVRAYFL